MCVCSHTQLFFFLKAWDIHQAVKSGLQELADGRFLFSYVSLYGLNFFLGGEGVYGLNFLQARITSIILK